MQTVFYLNVSLYRELLLKAFFVNLNAHIEKTFEG